MIGLPDCASPSHFIWAKTHPTANDGRAEPRGPMGQRITRFIGRSASWVSACSYRADNGASGTGPTLSNGLSLTLESTT